MKLRVVLFFVLCRSVAVAAPQPPMFGGLEREGAGKFAGPVLVSELGCVACHASGNPALAPKPGPDLSSVGSRVNGAHLKRFIAAPSAVKPGTTMPDVLAHLPEAQRSEVAIALAQYLASLGKPEPSALPAAEAVERGRKLYHSVGCVACHSPESPLPASVPLGPLEEKYSVASLARFLEDPLAVRPGGRMPDSHLEPAEAHDIASYLLRAQKTALAALLPEAALAARGRQLFVEHRCHACHSTGEKVAPPALAALNQARPGEGCLSEKPGPWPQYPLSAAQRAAVTTALAEAAKTWTPAEHTQIALTRLNCLACHQRGELGGVPASRQEFFTGKDENLGDQGRLPPPLTGVGAKLKTAWLRDVVANGAAARPYLNTRMPKFGEANSGALAGWLKEADTLPPAEFTRVAKTDKPHDAGRELAGSKGFNCIACHTFREKAAGAIRALDLMTMTERLEENWFHHYLENPHRFSPLTIMPAFWPDGKSPLPDMLGGDPGRQRDALWQWLAQGPEAREPQGLMLEPLVVEVKDEAVIIRRAFPGIGKRGLGVGYPGGINLAFDAAQMRLGSIWSGGFIEASGLWRGQGSGQARLLGRDVVNFPPGPALAILATPDAAWPVPDPTPRPSPHSFKGYTLDARQRPTLRYTVDGFAVEDFFIERRDTAGQLYLERTLRFPAAPPPGMHFRVAADKVIEARGENEFAVGKSLRVRLPRGATVRDADGAKELLLPARSALTIEYHLTGKP
jgi:mono/diheme cytochrome c family protein